MRKQWPPDWWLMVICFALVTMSAPSWAAQPAAPETKVERHSVTGTVVHVGYRSMSVEYANTAEGSFERLIPFEPDVKLAHVKNVRELKRGDTVRVDYADRYQKDANGEWKVIKATATEITLIKTAPIQQLGARETDAE